MVPRIFTEPVLILYPNSRTFQEGTRLTEVEVEMLLKELEKQLAAGCCSVLQLGS